MTAPLAPAPREAFEARLAGVACREDGVSVAQLEAEGWTIASEPNAWGSRWMTRDARDEEASRG